MNNVVVVTGANGFVGNAVCRELLTRGYSVRALVRPSDSAPQGTERHEITDITDATGLRQAIDGAWGLVHLAGRAHRLRERGDGAVREFWRVNVEGTRAVITAAAAVGVRSAVLASSIKAVANTASTSVGPATVPRPDDPYGASKLAAEAVFLDAGLNGSMHACVLRLPLVYGVGVKGNVLRLLHAVGRGVPIPVGRVRNARSMIGLGNLSAYFATALMPGPHAGRALFVTDGVNLSTPRFLELIGQALGTPARIVNVPLGVLRFLGWTGDRIAQLGAPMPLGSQDIERLVGSLVVDARETVTLLGKPPLLTPDVEIMNMAMWYRADRSSSR